jgi:hypothetical protein
MGLFTKRTAEPIVHPAVARRVHVDAPFDEVVSHLEAYSNLWSPKRAEAHRVMVGVTGVWTTIKLPKSVHPWQLHNLAFWMLDCPGLSHGDGTVIAHSAAGPDYPSYWLVRDPEIGDALCGWDETGQGWTVLVPGNDIVRYEDVPVGRTVANPSGHDDWVPVEVLLEDPGRDMNVENVSTAPTRRRLEQQNDFVM